MVRHIVIMLFVLPLNKIINVQNTHPSDCISINILKNTYIGIVGHRSCGPTIWMTSEIRSKRLDIMSLFIY